MRPKDLETVLTARPFRPFRLILSDGISLNISHPELLVVGRSLVIIETHDRPGEELRCALVHINRIELASRPR